MNEFCVNVEPTAEKGLKNLGKMLHDGYQLINARMFKKGSIASKYQFIYFMFEFQLNITKWRYPKFN